MATDIFSGDPLMTLGLDGSALHFVGGQPIMDQGFENQVVIALFTEEGWEGNEFIPDPDKKVGSGFLAATRKPITLTSLSNTEKEAVLALKSPAFGRVTATASNPTSNSLRVEILIQPPGQDSKIIVLTRNGLNWQAQAFNPAHERLNKVVA
jgi:phage gp46-like protein